MAYHQGFNLERRIILVGRTGNGKSATGNTILGANVFVSQRSPSSVTKDCQCATKSVGGRMITVVDTPGLFDTRLTQEEVRDRISTCIYMSAPGPHAFLVVLSVNRFTQEERETVRMIQETFGQDASRYTVVLFTHGDQLGNQSIRDFVMMSPELSAFIRTCNDRYYVFNNMSQDPGQTTVLLNIIDQMCSANGGGHYTNNMFERAAAIRFQVVPYQPPAPQPSTTTAVVARNNGPGFAAVVQFEKGPIGFGAGVRLDRRGIDAGVKAKLGPIKAEVKCSLRCCIQ